MAVLKTSPASVSPPTTPVITPEPDTATVSPPTGSSPSPTPSPGVEDDCPPCEDEPLFTSESPSGKACYCLGGGQKGRNNGDKEPWAWGLPACQYGSDGAVCPDICMKYSLMRVLILHLPFMQGLPPSDDDKPQVCSGNGAIPASRECLVSRIIVLRGTLPYFLTSNDSTDRIPATSCSPPSIPQILALRMWSMQRMLVRDVPAPTCSYRLEKTRQEHS